MNNLVYKQHLQYYNYYNYNITLQLNCTIAALTTDKVQQCITTQIKTKLKYRANNSYSARNACR